MSAGVTRNYVDTPLLRMDEVVRGSHSVEPTTGILNGDGGQARCDSCFQRLLGCGRPCGAKTP